MSLGVIYLKFLRDMTEAVESNEKKNLHPFLKFLESHRFLSKIWRKVNFSFTGALCCTRRGCVLGMGYNKPIPSDGNYYDYSSIDWELFANSRETGTSIGWTCGTFENDT